MRFALALLFLTSPAVASPVDDLIAVIEASFPEAPALVLTDDLTGQCGGGVEGRGAYCPTERRVFLDQAAENDPQAAYVAAHLYGHALQVTYGVADIALAAIRAEPAREAELRSMVTQQVECLAGVLVARANVDLPPLDDLFDTEPMTGSHWGANPVRTGPRVSIGLAARAASFAAGRAHADPAQCSVGEMRADLIAQADRWP